MVGRVETSLRLPGRFGLVQHLPMLGAVLSVSDYMKETWEPRVEKVEKRLMCWHGSLSYQGRALVINALTLLQIWHLCPVLTMPGWVRQSG